MSNPYSQHPQQFSETNRGGRNERWGSDDYRGAQNFRDDNSHRTNRAQNRPAWEQQQGGYSQQGNYGQQGGQQGNFGQSRYSPNVSGQGEYGQEWQDVGNYDDYQGNDFAGQQRGQWGQEYSPYSGQGEPEYNPNITPRRQQPIRAENQRWGQGQQSRDWQQQTSRDYQQQPWQGRSQAYLGNQFGRQQESGFGNQSHLGNHNYGLSNQTYGGQQFGSELGGDQSYRRFQSGGQSTGAFGLQQDITHRGKGPKGYTRTDERIREEICELLSDDFHIDASEITVEVKDGVVTLEGNVQERTLKHRVEDLADNVSGVKDVHNSLRVTRQASSQQQGSTEKSQEKSSKSH